MFVRMIVGSFAPDQLFNMSNERLCILRLSSLCFAFPVLELSGSDLYKFPMLKPVQNGGELRQVQAKNVGIYSRSLSTRSRNKLNVHKIAWTSNSSRRRRRICDRRSNITIRFSFNQRRANMTSFHGVEIENVRGSPALPIHDGLRHIRLAHAIPLHRRRT